MLVSLESPVFPVPLEPAQITSTLAPPGYEAGCPWFSFTLGGNQVSCSLGFGQLGFCSCLEEGGSLWLLPGASTSCGLSGMKPQGC